ncbi:hypothetical protein KGF54_004299 [Candida jiufengensis]|uniref:uncharacterized protein n=1 Tax=Candida jiufengensis TaxID=497108 RepID=UPI0022255E50|nr:uncharacterized protein KGF54_004299 [Candida jiufengensis]KAI5951225.1 hypothetical protein KGF54_004299 [Candida jiufengensis]
MLLIYRLIWFEFILSIVLAESFAPEVHNIHDIDSDEIHAWYFQNKEHLTSSSLWKEMQLYDKSNFSQFNQTLVHFNESNQTLILTALQPATFYELELELIGVLPYDLPELEEIISVNSTEAIRMIGQDLEKNTISAPSPVSASIVIACILVQYGIDDFTIDFIKENSDNKTMRVEYPSIPEDVEVETQAKKKLMFLCALFVKLPLKILKKILMIIKLLICLPFIILKIIIFFPLIILKKILMLIKKKILMIIKYKIIEIVLKVKDTVYGIIDKVIDITIVVIVSVKKVVYITVEEIEKGKFKTEETIIKAADLIMDTTKDTIVKVIEDKKKFDDKATEAMEKALWKSKQAKKKVLNKEFGEKVKEKFGVKSPYGLVD